ncbi:ketopantoate reductase PanE/ApbA carboxy-terminal protein [Rhizoctonia solani 123E]|uniref:Ketopantoate reductase PanE/ApbA carboxy-terminal protein n=1 Tax=Rhizoctonia solani 123E TaxID=1423351 RepID=A0A074RW90_9AGAM|nr:ketopantoate reductase PanE/ApbA carboxy-terminal protein [Rhizoctonia solani 123E]
MSTHDDILVVGFGAVGVIYALILSKSPNIRVTAIARGNFDKASTKGIDIKSQKHGNILGWKPDRGECVTEAADRAYKYVLVTTKALPDINPTSQILAPLLTEEYVKQHPSPTFVILQNGLGVERDLYVAVKSSWKTEPRVLSAAVYIQANLIGDRDVVEQGPFDKLVCGVYRPGLLVDDDPKNTPDEVERLETFARLIRTGNGDIEIVPDIQRKKFAKNLWNLSFAAFATLMRQPCTAFFWEETEEKIRPTLKKVLKEAVSVARALGYSEHAVPSSLVESTIEDTGGLHRPGKPSTHKPSMLVDMETRRPLEIEAIVGEVVRIGKEHEVDVPILEAVYTLLQVVQAGLIKGVYN